MLRIIHGPLGMWGKGKQLALEQKKTVNPFAPACKMSTITVTVPKSKSIGKIGVEAQGLPLLRVHPENWDIQIMLIPFAVPFVQGKENMKIWVGRCVERSSWAHQYQQKDRSARPPSLVSTCISHANSILEPLSVSIACLQWISGLNFKLLTSFPSR